MRAALHAARARGRRGSAAPDAVVLNPPGQLLHLLAYGMAAVGAPALRPQAAAQAVAAEGVPALQYQGLPLPRVEVRGTYPALERHAARPAKAGLQLQRWPSPGGARRNRV